MAPRVLPALPSRKLCIVSKPCSTGRNSRMNIASTFCQHIVCCVSRTSDDNSNTMHCLLLHTIVDECEELSMRLWFLLARCPACVGRHDHCEPENSWSGRLRRSRSHSSNNPEMEWAISQMCVVTSFLQVPMFYQWKWFSVTCCVSSPFRSSWWR